RRFLPNIRRRRPSLPSRSSTTKSRSDEVAATGTGSAARRLSGLPADSFVKPVVAILGPTATGKSALALTIAAHYGGEIINCDSTAVYRGFDIGTDKVPLSERGGIRHHLIDIVDPADEYTAAQFARDAARTIRDIHARGKLPLIVGGTGFYYRALTRGLFPGRGRDAELRARLETVAARRGVGFLHRMLRRVDRESAD